MSALDKLLPDYGLEYINMLFVNRKFSTAQFTHWGSLQLLLLFHLYPLGPPLTDVCSWGLGCPVRTFGGQGGRGYSDTDVCTFW